nr:PREDICTED: uncharacterized protein LOC102348791 isoform X2 [Latimeria chalumnae]|eukprot:XP_014351810.1 PREDICTED: uncharacterized protein LOC102348791 isoform X2 [Latimeria chalumnae]
MVSRARNSTSWREVMPQYDLRKHTYDLCLSMTASLVERIASLMYSAQFLTQYECDIIMSKPVVQHKALALLSAVQRKGRPACRTFYQALEEWDPALSQKLTGKPAGTPQSAYTYHVTIYNSEVKGCIFGEQSSLYMVERLSVEDTQELSHVNHRPENTQGKCCPVCAPVRHEGAIWAGLEAPGITHPAKRIEIVDSNVKHMVAGDRNILQITEEDSDDTMESTETESFQKSW